MNHNSYFFLVRSLGIAKKLATVSSYTQISKATLEKILKGRGAYEGCLSTRARLEDFVNQNENKTGRAFSTKQKGENYARKYS